MHDQKTAAKTRRDPCILARRKRTHVIYQVTSGRKRRFDHTRSPGINRKQRRKDLDLIDRTLSFVTFLEALNERKDPCRLFRLANFETVGARAFTSDVDDVGSVRDVALRGFDIALDLQRSISRKRIFGGVYDPHH